MSLRPTGLPTPATFSSAIKRPRAAVRVARCAAIGLAVWIGGERPCLAKLVFAVPGADAKAKAEREAKFQTMLKTGSGVDVTIGADGTVTLAAGANPTTAFGKQLKEIIDDQNNAVKISHVNLIRIRDPKNPGQATETFIPIAMFNSGNHLVNVDSIANLPTAANTGAATQQSILIHELAEAYDAVKNKHGIDDAHAAGVKAEETIATEMNGGAAIVRVSADRPAGTKVMTVVYRKTSDNSTKSLKITFDDNWIVSKTELALAGNLNTEHYVSTEPCRPPSDCSSATVSLDTWPPEYADNGLRWSLSSHYQYRGFYRFQDVSGADASVVTNTADSSGNGADLFFGAKVGDLPIWDIDVWATAGGYMSGGLSTNATLVDGRRVTNDVADYGVGFGFRLQRPLHHGFSCWASVEALYEWNRNHYQESYLGVPGFSELRTHTSWTGEYGIGTTYWIRPRLGFDVGVAYHGQFKAANADENLRVGVGVVLTAGRRPLF